MHRVKLLYIGGYGRSGSTLLERILGQVPGIVAVGEMRHIWNRSFRDNQLCSCGTPFDECNFWSEVVRDAFGSRQAIDADEIIRLKRSVDRIAHIPRIVKSWRGTTGNFDVRLRRYASLLGTLYRSIQKVSGAEVIVDSSKDPSFAFVLASAPDLQMTVVHLVRDSRAVAYSWMRKKQRLASAGQPTYMPIAGPVKSAFRWNAYNYPFHLLRRFVRYKRLRYEELLRCPRESVQEVLDLVGACQDRQAMSFLSNDTVQLATNHTVSGNPLRFHEGTLKLEQDDQWVSDMPRMKRWLVGTLTMHLMWRYGYWNREPNAIYFGTKGAKSCADRGRPAR